MTENEKEIQRKYYKMGYEDGYEQVLKLIVGVLNGRNASLNGIDYSDPNKLKRILNQITALVPKK